MVEEAKSILQTDQVFSLSQTGFLSEMNCARVVMAPAGISTTFECLAYQTPIMFLPEQHDGNFSNYHRLAVYSGDVWRFRKHFAEALICYREGWDRFSKISDYYERYEGMVSNPDDDTLRDMQRALQAGMQQIKTHPLMETLVRYQREILSPLVGGYYGAQQIASRITAALSGK
jgi:hypothetical protein